MERRVTQMQARTEGLERLKLPMEDLPDNMGRRFASAMAGSRINAVLAATQKTTG